MSEISISDIGRICHIKNLKRTISNKNTWYTGIWNKQLKIVASGGQGTKGDHVLIERAKLIM